MRPRTKAERELQWWQEELYRIAMWYHGHIESLWGIPSPGPHDVLPGFEGAIAAFRHADKDRYQNLLQLPGGAYGHVLDIGSGPLCPATWLGGTCFAAEPLAADFIKIGYPMDAWGAVLVPHPAENLWMFPDRFFDCIVSNNAMDHVDDFETVALEIQRLAKPGATIRLNICYRHEPTLSEPQVIDDARVHAAFNRLRLTRIREQGPEESKEVLWGIS